MVSSVILDQSLIRNITEIFPGHEIVTFQSVHKGAVCEHRQLQPLRHDSVTHVSQTITRITRKRHPLPAEPQQTFATRSELDIYVHFFLTHVIL